MRAMLLGRLGSMATLMAEWSSTISLCRRSPPATSHSTRPRRKFNMLTRLFAPRSTGHRTALVLVALLVLTTAMAALPAQAVPPSPAALEGTVNWAAKPEALSNNGDVGYPWSTVDRNDVTHTVYLTDNGNIWYMNSANRVGIRLDQ